MALDGLVRGLPLLKPQGGGGGGVLQPKILSVRQTKGSWNSALNGTVGTLPKDDSVWFCAGGSAGTWGHIMNAWPTQFGIFEALPLAEYNYGGNCLGQLFMLYIPPGRTGTITTAFNWQETGSNYENCYMVECEVENVQGVLERSAAHGLTGTSHAFQLAPWQADQGLLNIFGGMWDDGGAGVSSVVNNGMEHFVAGYGYALANIGIGWDTPRTNARGITVTGHNDVAAHVSALLY